MQHQVLISDWSLSTHTPSAAGVPLHTLLCLVSYQSLGSKELNEQMKQSRQTREDNYLWAQAVVKADDA